MIKKLFRQKCFQKACIFYWFLLSSGCSILPRYLTFMYIIIFFQLDFGRSTKFEPYIDDSDPSKGVKLRELAGDIRRLILVRPYDRGIICGLLKQAVGSLYWRGLRKSFKISPESADWLTPSILSYWYVSLCETNIRLMDLNHDKIPACSLKGGPKVLVWYWQAVVVYTSLQSTDIFSLWWLPYCLVPNRRKMDWSRMVPWSNSGIPWWSTRGSWSVFLWYRIDLSPKIYCWYTIIYISVCCIVFFVILNMCSLELYMGTIHRVKFLIGWTFDRTLQLCTCPAWHCARCGTVDSKSMHVHRSSLQHKFSWSESQLTTCKA